MKEAAKNLIACGGCSVGYCLAFVTALSSGLYITPQTAAAETVDVKGGVFGKPSAEPLGSGDRIGGRRALESVRNRGFSDQHAMAVVSLIVDGSSPEHAIEHLRKLTRLKKHRRVTFGSVYLVGPATLEGLEALRDAPAGRTSAVSDSASESAYPSLYAGLKQAGLAHYRIVEIDGLMERLGLRFSPTWLVYYRGGYYVFEGFESPRTLFGRHGEFLKGGQ